MSLYKRIVMISFLTLFFEGLVTGCGNYKVQEVEQKATKGSIEAEIIPEEEPLIDGLDQLSMEGPDYEMLKDLPVPETQAAPEYLRVGVEHENIAELQNRLMTLGFMDNDEPTEYFGEVTISGVMTLLRHNDLVQF